MRIDLNKPAKLPESPEVPPPETLVTMKLDQLNPRNNRTYQLATTSNKRLEEELAEDDD